MEVSISENNTSVSADLLKLNEDEIQNPDDAGWMQFLRDHRELIISGSTWVPLTEETMFRYRYRIRDFIVDILKLPVGLDAAFRVINRLGSDSDFNLSLDGCWAPDNSQVIELRHRFDTCKYREQELDAPTY